MLCVVDGECNRECCVWLMQNITGSVVCSWLGVTVADGECDRECCVWLMGSVTGSVVCG